MWGPNEHYRDRHFAYNCSTRESDGAMGLETMGCINDWIEDRIEVGETLKLNNGSVLVHCEKFQGRVRKVSEAVTGCHYNGTVYHEGQRWTEPNGHPSAKYVVMECFRSNSSGYFEKKTVGCVAEERLETQTFDMKENTWISSFETVLLSHPIGDMCVETLPGQVKMLPLKDVPCTVDGSKYDDGEVWIDKKRGAKMNCERGVVYKIACIIGELQYNLGRKYRLDNGCEFYCHSQTNLYFCENRLEGFERADNN